MRLVKTHGSLNEIFAADAAPSSWASEAALRDFVRAVCARDSWTGGSDGIYFYDSSQARTQAWFYNPDGTPAEFCGNGMRGLGRLILDQRGTQTEVVESGARRYTIHRAPATPEGVRQVLLELPEVAFAPAPPAPFHAYTAVTVPNPHVVAVVAEYSEPDLIAAAHRAPQVFPNGANVSFLLPLPTPSTSAAPPAPTNPSTSAAPLAPEVFVRTFERGAGLTPSCGSGVVASRAAYSRVTGLDPARRVLVRNAGGVAAAWIQVRDGAWFPVLEGNATVVYTAEADDAARQQAPLTWAAAETAAYAQLTDHNTLVLKANAITTAHP